MEILLVRHGESEGNAQDRMQGHSDFPLSALGRAQAETLGLWLRAQRIGWQRLYASPLKRARETAEIVVSVTGSEPAVLEPALMELNAGGLEGLTFSEIGTQFPSYTARGVGDLGDFSEYGGESYADVQERAASVCERLTAAHRERGDRIALIGHGGFHFQLLKQLVCRPVPRVCIVRMGNCSATLVRLRERRGTFMGEVVWHLPVELMGGSAREGAGL